MKAATWNAPQAWSKTGVIVRMRIFNEAMVALSILPFHSFPSLLNYPTISSICISPFLKRLAISSYQRCVSPWSERQWQRRRRNHSNQITCTYWRLSWFRQQIEIPNKTTIHVQHFLICVFLPFAKRFIVMETREHYFLSLFHKKNPLIRLSLFDASESCRISAIPANFDRQQRSGDFQGFLIVDFLVLWSWFLWPHAEGCLLLMSVNHAWCNSKEEWNPHLLEYLSFRFLRRRMLRSYLRAIEKESGKMSEEF